MTTNKEKFYNSYGLDRSIPRSFLKRQELTNLFAIPKKETHEQMPHFYNFVEDDTHMTDILFLPWDYIKKKKYAFAIVVVDVATGATDAEPIEMRDEYEETDDGKKLKTKWNGPTPKDTTDAIEKIYKRGTYLKKPHLLITDSGREFKSEIFQNFLRKNNIQWKKSIGGRHRQVALVERRNYTIGRAIMMRQHAISSITQKECRLWVADFPNLIYWVNKRFEHEPPTDESLYKKFGDPWLEKKQILPIGTVVRVMLTEPKDFKERGVKGVFRAGDMRYTQDTYKIISYIFDPHQPILYKLNQKLKPHEKVVYSRQQLQVVDRNEEDVPHTITTEVNGEFRIKKLINKRKIGNKTEYLVFWYGYPIEDASWVSKSKIPKSFVDAYENP